MWRRVDLVWTDVSEERITPIFRVDKSENEEPAWAGGCSVRGKHASTLIELLMETVLWNPLLGSCNSRTTTMKTGVFSMSSVSRSYLEDNRGDPVGC
jgi:hypothetical protein